jgi:hypothetical protein
VPAPSGSFRVRRDRQLGENPHLLRNITQRIAGQISASEAAIVSIFRK